MQTIPYRTIRNKPGEFEQALESEGIVILSKNGRPLGIVLSTFQESLETAIVLASAVRAQRAVSNMREAARRQGISNLSDAEIRDEINAVRAARRE